MPRGKKAGPRGRGQPQPQYPPRNRQMETSFTPFAGAGTSSPRGGHRGLTLQDEARNTERHHTFWGTDQRLRHSKVDFVSAGRLNPVEPPPTDAESAMADMRLDSPPLEDVIVEVEGEDETVGQDEPEPLYFIDIVGDKQASTGLPPPQTRLRSSSPTPSNSSDEVILFQGRNNGRDGTPRSSKAPRVLTDPIYSRIEVAEHKVHKREALPEATGSKWVSTNAPEEPAGLPSGEFDAILSEPKSKRGRRGRQGKQEDEDAIAADYIANIEGGEDSQGWVYTAWPERPLDVGQDEAESPREPDQSSESPLHGGWDRAAICDFDDLSTSDGVMGEVQAILSKRERAGGVQYLVVWDGQSVDEARWVPAVTLSGTEALLHINAFEAEEKLVAEYQAADEEDSDDSEDLESDDAADDEDDQDLWQRKADHLTDEQIARLLSKQEELGMGSNELLLLDDADEDDEIPLRTNHFSPSMLAFHEAQTTDRGTKRPRGEFPDATAMANAYDGFDVMDFDRPSLKRKPKGRKGKLQFDLSDSELEASRQAAYENDRSKKKERKQEREALRAAGLLGSKNGKPDLKEKYREGMGIMEVKDEMKAFLIGNDAMLKLPPMGKADRKVVHELANAFNLKSKSAGEGSNRFPILYRTSRTLTYVERTFDAVDAKITRRFLPRMDVSGKRAGGGSKGFGRGGGFGNAGVSYRDGDVVGASAPELGAENRGRAMLEKMGWSTGTALGALNNKGILQPVSHVVKTTKAGLG